MIDAELISLLQCPRTKQPLALDTDTTRLREINQEIAAGHLAATSGQTSPTPLDGVLHNADRSMTYPIAGGMLSLLPDDALARVEGGVHPAVDSQQKTEIQRRQMEQYSAVYERWTGGEQGITRALQKQLHHRYQAPFTDATVLDIGNGGTPPETQLGVELARVIKRFIALDKSPDMLGRSGLFGDLILGDAFTLPFKSDAVDIAMVNNTIHHFGLSRGERSADKLHAFVAEALRVARKGVIGVELLVPPLGESVERGLTRTTGFMPTFVYSANFYRHSFEQFGLQVTDFGVMKLRELTSPWRVIPPVLDFTWLRVPTFLIPYSFLFFFIEK